jgi:hypothetical protein
MERKNLRQFFLPTNRPGWAMSLSEGVTLFAPQAERDSVLIIKYFLTLFD